LNINNLKRKRGNNKLNPKTRKGTKIMKTTMQDIANYYNESEEINTFDLECMIKEAGFISDCGTDWGICHNDTDKVVIDDNGNAIVVNL